MAETERSRLIELVWEDSQEFPTIYANQLMVSHASGDEFYLVFGEASPPTDLRPGSVPDHILVRPVAKIVLAPGAMMRVTTAIQQNWSNFADKASKREEDEHGERTN